MLNNTGRQVVVTILMIALSYRDGDDLIWSDQIWSDLLDSYFFCGVRTTSSPTSHRFRLFEGTIAKTLRFPTVAAVPAPDKQDSSVMRASCVGVMMLPRIVVRFRKDWGWGGVVEHRTRRISARICIYYTWNWLLPDTRYVHMISRCAEVAKISSQWLAKFQHRNGGGGLSACSAWGLA